MANPIWQTPGGNLGSIPENYFFELPLLATDPAGGNVTFKALAGTFPPGLHVSQNGILQGVPILTDVTNVTRSYEFSIRASDASKANVTDNSFNVTISNIIPPQITPRINNLGTIFDGAFYTLQLRAIEVNPNATLTWSLENGALPPGVTLSSSGLISGFIPPITSQGNTGLIGFSNAPYNEFGFENSTSYQSQTYIFTVKVYDGVNYDSLTYKVFVAARNQYEADTTYNTVDENLTVDQGNLYLPVLTTLAGPLPTARSSAKYAFQFNAVDPNNNAITFVCPGSSASGYDQNGDDIGHLSGVGYDTLGFDQQNLTLPAGLTLDPTTGWLNGTLGYQSAATSTYNFQIYAQETANPTIISKTLQYSLTVLGDITNTITWNTSANLGIIDNGTISQFSVAATSNAGKTLKYQLVSDQSHLPQGLQLLSNGLIIGRTTFEYFTLDQGLTTIDGNSQMFDNLYTFVVEAYSTDSSVSSNQTFTILVNNFNRIPYENLYLKALTSMDQRQAFLNIVNNTELFPPQYIYRLGDPNFGVAKDVRSLFLPGVTPSQTAAYLAAMSTNTYNKRIEFSDVKTAIAVDQNFNVKYEVVYLELYDNETIVNPLTGVVSSPSNSNYDSAISANVYPNSFENMSSVISTNLGFSNQGALPEWMTSPQANKKQLGLIRAIVLAYTLPNYSSLIAYRLKTNNIAFNNIDFVADRYDLDNVLSKNFNLGTTSFISSKETTFDKINRALIGTIVTSVNYGITGLSFSMINNRSVSYIQSRGGLDGIMNFYNGATLVFLQQENYPGETGLYDGWTSNGVLIPGYNEFLNSSAIPSGSVGFPSSPTIGQVVTVNNVIYIYSNTFDTNGTITGQGWKIANQRAGVWQINISNTNIVTLSFKTFLRSTGVGSAKIASTVMPTDQVQLNLGSYQNNTVAYYNPILGVGNSVPSYNIVATLLNSTSDYTKFDHNGTRFINNRDVYNDPESGDSWLKFPKTNVLY